MGERDVRAKCFQSKGIVVIASFAASPHPAWDVSRTNGELRRWLFDAQSKLLPLFDHYQKKGRSPDPGGCAGTGELTIFPGAAARTLAARH
jgi:hypothetical protein